jgi:hypothetical protein
MISKYLNVKDFYVLPLVWNVLHVNKHISNMSHKVKGLDYNRYRKKKGSLSLGNYQAAKNSVLREDKATVAHLLFN